MESWLFTVKKISKRNGKYIGLNKWKSTCRFPSERRFYNLHSGTLSGQAFSFDWIPDCLIFFSKDFVFVDNKISFLSSVYFCEQPCYDILFRIKYSKTNCSISTVLEEEGNVAWGDNLQQCLSYSRRNRKCKFKWVYTNIIKISDEVSMSTLSLKRNVGLQWGITVTDVACRIGHLKGLDESPIIYR